MFILYRRYILIANLLEYPSLNASRTINHSERPSSWSLSWSRISWQNYFWWPNVCRICQIGEHIVNHGLAISVEGCERWTLTATTLNLTVKLGAYPDICAKGLENWTYTLWFSRKYKERNAPTNEPMNQQTRVITIAPSDHNIGKTAEALFIHSFIN